jgi:hypothetical protein
MVIRNIWPGARTSGSAAWSSTFAGQSQQGHGRPLPRPALIDETTTFLAAGTPVYEVIDYPAGRRLAAYLHDELHIYDLDVNGNDTASTQSAMPSLRIRHHPGAAPSRLTARPSHNVVAGLRPGHYHR